MKQFVPSCRLLAKVCDKVASVSGESASGPQTMSTVISHAGSRNTGVGDRCFDAIAVSTCR